MFGKISTFFHRVDGDASAFGTAAGLPMLVVTVFGPSAESGISCLCSTQCQGKDQRCIPYHLDFNLSSDCVGYWLPTGHVIAGRKQGTDSLMVELMPDGVSL